MNSTTNGRLKIILREADRVFDSGGTTVWMSPGAFISLNRYLSLFWSMPVPIYQNLGGEHEEAKFRILAGVSMNFG